MKIYQLPMGARFLHDGEEYVKTGPMFGSGKGGQKMFPRYVELQALDAPAAASKASATLPRDKVLAAFEAFVADCRALVDTEGMVQLARARERFLKSID